MINRYDTWTKLKEVVLGDVNLSLCNMIDDLDDRKRMTEILYDAKDTLESIKSIFESFNVKVWRPNIIEYDKNKTYSTPYINLKAVGNSIASFDHFFTVANTVVEMSSYSINSYFDYLQYHHIWSHQFQQGSRWLSMPRPCYDLEKMDPTAYIDNNEPYADSPSFQLCGKHIFHAETGTINQKGLTWIKREFPEFKFIPIKGTKGHLDSYFSILKPGLVISSLPKSQFPEQFKNWDFITLGPENYDDIKIIDEFIQDTDYENTTLAVNCLSLDEENVIILKHIVDKHPEIMKAIEKHKINIIPLKYDASRWINQGISCMCNQIEREGKLINYFE